jgi:hypothetical protein
MNSRDGEEYGHGLFLRHNSGIFLEGLRKMKKISVRRIGLHIAILKSVPTEYAVGFNSIPNFSNLY